MTDTAKHQWTFFRVGGFDQVRIETGADIAHLDQLDQKLWVALACPTTGIHFDARTLELMDTDRDGRLRAPEILAAAKWATAMLKDPNLLVAGAASLPLDAINPVTPEGRQLLDSARHILNCLGKPDATAISVADTADTTKIFAGSKLNGDGVVTEDSTADVEVRRVLGEIVDCLGGVADRGGKPGVNADTVGRFFAAAQAYADWWKAAEAKAAEVLPLGAGTAAAMAAFVAVQAKVDDYFARCRLAAFDARALGAINRQEADYLALGAKTLTLTAGEIAEFPLARVDADRPLPLTGPGLNPAWAGNMAAFAAAVRPLTGAQEVMTCAEWLTLSGKFAAFGAWQAAKAGAVVEKLGLDRIRAILAGGSRAALDALIAEDLKKEPEAAAITAVEKLVRLNRDLCKLLNNFVSFRDFYARKDKAVFQAGTLYLDGRSCDLCVNVADAGKHAALAALAKTYLAYCDCTRPSGEKMQIAAAFTGGDSDNLMLGRNGVFYDRQGRDWDAAITKIVDNPISIRQAFWAPYKKFLRMIEEQVAKRAAAADANATAKLQTNANTLAAAGASDVPPPPPPPPPKKVDPGMLAAIGLVLATLLAALGGIFGAFAKLPPWQMPLAIAGIMLAISVPSMVIAWLKLRQRTLGPILDANGWAVNVRAKINVPFGGSLTKLAVLPAHAVRSLADPYAEKKSPWPVVVIVLVLLALAGHVLNNMGYVNQWTHGRLGTPKAKTVAVAPAAPTAPAASAAVK